MTNLDTDRWLCGDVLLGKHGELWFLVAVSFDILFVIELEEPHTELTVATDSVQDNLSLMARGVDRDYVTLRVSVTDADALAHWTEGLDEENLDYRVAGAARRGLTGEKYDSVFSDRGVL